MTEVCLLGPVHVRVRGQVFGPGDFGGRKPKQIFEMLALARGRPVSKDRLADQLWGDRLPDNVAGTLESYVSVFRRQLAPTSLIETQPGGYRLASEQIHLDLDRFDDLVARAARSGPRAGWRLLKEALGLVRGDVVEDEPYAQWAENERRIYRDRTVRARVDSGEAALACRDLYGALSEGERALEDDPVNEPACRLVMLTTYLMGRQDAALRTFERFQRTLRDELGVEPMKETGELCLAIRHHVPAAALLPPPAWDDLPRITELHRDLVPFIDREDQLRYLASCVSGGLAGSYRLALVEGGAGMGKSRLLREATDAVTGAPVGVATCSRLEQDLPFVPLAMALRAALPPGGVDPLAQVLSELGPDAGEAGLARAVEALAALVASASPTVVVLDDVHWADTYTFTALSYLRHRCAALPLVVVASFDPAEVGPRHPLNSLAPDVRLRLGPLPEAAVDALGGPCTFARTGGHPFLVAACLQAEAHASPDALPLLVGSWVLQQCQAAGPRAHQLLVTAAVLGRAFVPEELTSVVSGDPAELAEELERLCQWGPLRVEGAGFDFRYDLVREVLTESISPARRRLVRQLLDPLPSSPPRSPAAPPRTQTR